MADTPETADDNKFNETLKRMLKTPPKPHDSSKSGEVGEKPPEIDKRA